MFTHSRLPFVLILAALLTTGIMAGSAAQDEPRKKPAADRAKDSSVGDLSLNRAGDTPAIKVHTDAPKIHFPEPIHDFGKISRGAKVSHIFKVENQGATPLKLIKAKGS